MEKSLDPGKIGRKITTKDMIMCALFTALIAVGAFIKVPVPVVPFTLQFLFTMLAGLIMGGRLGAISIDKQSGIDLDQILFSTAKSVFQAVFQWFYRRIAAGVVINNGKCKPCGKRLAVNAAADHPQHRDKKYDRDHMKFIIF